jgi:hypothetical protein
MNWRQGLPGWPLLRRSPHLLLAPAQRNNFRSFPQRAILEKLFVMNRLRAGGESGIGRLSTCE